MKNLFLHIGPPKTGSSTIQEFLYQNIDNLNKSGYLYPQTGIKLSAQHNLAHLIINSKKANSTRGTWQEVHQEIEEEKLDNVIISSEYFALANRKQIKILETELEPYQVKVIIYLRRQDLRLESQYAQNVKKGLCATNILPFVETKKDESDYYQLLKPWRRVFGINNVIVRPLEKTQVPNICHDILNVIGIKESAHFNDIDSKNLKPGRKTLEVLKLANHVYQNMPRQQKKKSIEQINDYLTKNWSEKNKYRLLSYSDSVKILDCYEQSNQAVAREYLGREDGILFYEKLENYEKDDFTTEDLSKEELLSLILAFQYNLLET